MKLSHANAVDEGSHAKQAVIIIIIIIVVVVVGGGGGGGSNPWVLCSLTFLALHSVVADTLRIFC
jgi:hypothetical protein